ncbi:hypothetical protein KKI24_04935 [bacterium]|nr:hypothetical protein [bacterium]
MINKKSKDSMRSELNQAIAEFIARGGIIKKVMVQGPNQEAEDGMRSDFFEQGLDNMDSDNEPIIKMIRQNTTNN